jgi:hypothetical protein
VNVGRLEISTEQHLSIRAASLGIVVVGKSIRSCPCDINTAAVEISVTFQ